MRPAPGPAATAGSRPPPRRLERPAPQRSRIVSQVSSGYSRLVCRRFFLWFSLAATQQAAPARALALGSVTGRRAARWRLRLRAQSELAALSTARVGRRRLRCRSTERLARLECLEEQGPEKAVHDRGRVVRSRHAREAPIEVQLVTGRSTVLGVQHRLNHRARGIGLVTEPAGELKAVRSLGDAARPTKLLMIQEDAGRVLDLGAAIETDAAIAHLHRELRVSASEPRDLRLELRRGSRARLEITVTARAVHVVERGQ